MRTEVFHSVERVVLIFFLSFFPTHRPSLPLAVLQIRPLLPLKLRTTLRLTRRRVARLTAHPRRQPIHLHRRATSHPRPRWLLFSLSSRIPSILRLRRDIRRHQKTLPTTPKTHDLNPALYILFHLPARLTSGVLITHTRKGKTRVSADA